MSAHSSQRKVIMPITARAAATSLHDVSICSLDMVLVPPFFRLKDTGLSSHLGIAYDALSRDT